MGEPRSAPLMPTGRVAIVAYHAGGAEILSSWLCRNPCEYDAIVDGPALPIFQRKIPNLVLTNSTHALSRCSWVLSGTGTSDMEHRVRCQAKRLALYNVAFLDHWTSYTKRFMWEGVSLLPDEIWVGDHHALELAKRQIPEVRSSLVENPYWLDSVEENNLKTMDQSGGVLYVSTNIDASPQSGSWGLSDHWLLRETINCLINGSSFKEIAALTIRKHPSESQQKYANFTDSRIAIQNDDKDSLIASIRQHVCIIGFNSMAQVVGKLCGKKSVNLSIDGIDAQSIPEEYIDQIIRLGTPI